MISWGVFANKIKKIALQKQHIFLLNGEVIWQASDSPFSKEPHVLTYLLNQSDPYPSCHKPVLLGII